MQASTSKQGSFHSQIAGIQAIVSETTQKADAPRQSIGGVTKAASFVQKMKGMWLDRQAAEQGSAGGTKLRSPQGLTSPSLNNAAKLSPHRPVDGAQRKSPVPEPLVVEEEDMEEQDSERMMAVCSKVVGWWKWRTMAHLFDVWMSSVHEKGETVPAVGPPVASVKIAETRSAAPQTPRDGPVALSLRDSGPCLPDNVPSLTDYEGLDAFVDAEVGGAREKTHNHVADHAGVAGEKHPVVATHISAKPPSAGTAAGAVYLVPAPVRGMQVSLDVVGCPSAAVLGRNRIYLPTAVFAAFSQFQAAHLGSSLLPSAAEPVLIAVNGTAFEAWAAPDLAPSAIALDSVQAISISTSIGERVRVWPLDLSSGLCNVAVALLSVRLKDKSSHLGLNGLDKNRFSEHCFQVLQGHPLSAGRRLLIGYGYWRLEVSVDHLDDPWSEILLAFHEGAHGRLGARTWVSQLPPKVLVLVSQLFWQGSCVNTVLNVSSKLIYNFWDGANYEGRRSAEVVFGGGREHVLIRGENTGPPAQPVLNIAAPGRSASPPEKRSSSVPLTFSPAPFSTTLRPQPIPTTIGPSTAFSLFALPLPSSLSSHGASQENTPQARYSPTPAQKPEHAASAVGYAGSYGRMLQPMQLGPVFPEPAAREPTARASGVSGVSNSSPQILTTTSADWAVDSTHHITSHFAGTQTPKPDAIISNMLFKASLEHHESLLQLDEMSMVAAASLQREQKFVEIMKAVVSRNQTKGGDWSYLATVLQNYSEEVSANLRIIEKQNQRHAQPNSQLYNRLRDRAPLSNRTTTLDTVEEGKEDPSTLRLYDLEYGREEARIRANEAQRIREMALSVTKDQRRSALLVSSLAGGISSSPVLSAERGEMSSPQWGATSKTGEAGGSTSAVQSSKEDQLPAMQTASNAGSGRPGNGQNSMEREALRAHRVEKLKDAIQSSASSPTAVLSNRNGSAVTTQQRSSPALANTQGDPQTSCDAQDASKRTPHVMVTVVSAEHLPNMDFIGKYDGLVEINWEGQRFKTNPKKQSYDPVWNEDFAFKFDYEGVNAHGVGDLILSLKVCDATAVTGYENIGQAVLPASRLNTFLITGKNRASLTEAGLAVKDKMGAQVIGKDKQPCFLNIKLQLFLDPVLLTDETLKKTGGWFEGMFGCGTAPTDIGAHGNGGKDSAMPFMTKAKVAASRSPEFNGSRTGLSTEEKRLLDQQDDELKNALDSGTLPSPVRVLYFFPQTMRFFGGCRVILATASDVNVIYLQNAIKEAQQRRDTPIENSLDSILPPPAASGRKKLDSPYFTGVGQSFNPSPGNDDGRGSLFGRPSAAQILEGDLMDRGNPDGAPRTSVVTRDREEKRLDEMATTLLANQTLAHKTTRAGSIFAVVGRESEEEEGGVLKANAVGEVDVEEQQHARSDTDLRPRPTQGEGASSAVSHAIKEQQQIGGGAGSLFGRPSPAQLLALAGSG